ncbi:MAG TPA: RNA polymerase sigma factor SigF, partial [Streptomyces sp.]|nr:RNA polymerase sigma factor SigF [Streptomyces sp.]
SARAQDPARAPVPAQAPAQDPAPASADTPPAAATGHEPEDPFGPHDWPDEEPEPDWTQG